MEEAQLIAQGGAAREDVIVLDLSGMHCGGCSSRVKGILEAHPSVSQANVNLTTEVALVRVSLPTLPDSAVNGGAREEELQAIVAQLLKVLADNGFKAKVRDKQQTNAAAAAVVKSRREERISR